jgi:hypothetical protein
MVVNGLNSIVMTYSETRVVCVTTFFPIVPPARLYSRAEVLSRPSPVLVALTGSATACYAGEDEGKTKLEVLTSAQLGEYSLKLDTDKPQNVGVPDPSGLKPLRQETPGPFLGLKLSRPLPDSFWNFVR